MPHSQFLHRAVGHPASPAAATSGSPVHLVLSRLDGVKRSGRGWMARCPAHSDRNASLSVAEGDDGRVLLHDFAGCGAAAVLAAIGLSITDLFPRRLGHYTSPAERAAAAERARLTRIAAALSALASESTVVQIAAREIAAGRALSPADVDRLSLAAERIRDAHSVLWPSRRTFKEIVSGIHRAKEAA